MWSSQAVTTRKDRVRVRARGRGRTRLKRALSTPRGSWTDYRLWAMDLSQVTIVLVRPARPANVAAACRAMKNMGLRHLRIVDPPPGLDDRDTRASAYKAWDVLDGAETASSLREAVADATLVAGTWPWSSAPSRAGSPPSSSGCVTSSCTWTRTPPSRR